jgi:cell division protein FtsB
MSTRKFGTYATREEFLENEIRTLNYHIQSMIDTMKVMSMNRQDMSDELERMKQEIKTAVLAEREACAKICEEPYQGSPKGIAEQIRARGQE